MVAKYQFQLIDSASGKTIAQPIPMPAPYPFNVGDFYIFGGNNRAQVSAIAHFFTNVGPDQIYTTYLSLSQAAFAATHDETVFSGGDPVVPWPRR
ncbi:hypothetical protein [Bradyrhizobium sp. 2TAF24]|uniref:hypothetical protein n=1 Tax=Bradyrhizobium sp. 2TAF24 TaxID=3233011 RepID=UPI003F8E59AF